jgi:outer membrane protein TolC
MERKIVSVMLVGLSMVFLLDSVSFAAGKEELARIETRFSEDLFLPDLLKYAYESNPSVTASKESWKMFIENYRLGKSYPDPQLMMTYFPSPIETRLGPQDWNLTLSQSIPFPGRLAMKARVLESDTKISRLRLDQTIKTLVTAITAAFYELVYIQKAVEIARVNFKFNQELLTISHNAYAGDRAVFYDVAKARAQTAQIQYDILLLEELERTEKAGINTMLNRSLGADLGTAQELVFRDIVYSLDEIYELSTVNQEDILIADERIQKTGHEILLSKYDVLPSFKLGLFYAGIGDPDVPAPPRDAGDDAVGIQLGLTLPLWFGKNRSMVNRALAGKRKAEADRQTVANQTKERISRLWFKLQNARRLIVLYEENLVPQSLRSLQTAETWFRQGQGSFSDFLEIQATAYNFQLSLARARADYGKALVGLEQMAGVVLDKKKAPKTEGNQS